jgi:hypothetical protein
MLIPGCKNCSIWQFSPLKDSRTIITWSSDYSKGSFHAFKSTQEWIANLKREMGLKICYKLGG